MCSNSSNQFLSDVKAGKLDIDITEGTNVADHAAAMAYVNYLGTISPSRSYCRV